VKAMKCNSLIPSECLDHLVYRGSKTKIWNSKLSKLKLCHRNKELAAFNKYNYTVLWHKMLSEV